jgi:hypothetical protein
MGNSASQAEQTSEQGQFYCKWYCTPLLGILWRGLERSVWF